MFKEAKSNAGRREETIVKDDEGEARRSKVDYGEENTSRQTRTRAETEENDDE